MRRRRLWRELLTHATSIAYLCVALGLLSGCSALTRFDYNFTGSSDGGADSGATDSGADSGTSDGGSTDAGPDAGELPCPAPCLGELAVDYLPDTQSAGTAMWRYLASNRSDPLRLDVTEMTWGTNRFESGGAEIGTCAALTCGGLAAPGAIRMTGDSDTDPVIQLIVPTTGRYRIGGTANLEGAGGDQVLVISRESQRDMLFTTMLSTGSAVAIDELVSLVAGDTVRFTVVPVAAIDSASAAVTLWISGPSGASTCEAAYSLNDWPTLAGECGAGAVMLLSTGGGLPTETESLAPFGNATRIDQANGSFATLMGTISADLSSDFTVQLWARFASLPALGSSETVLANVGSAAGGVFLEFSSISGFIEFRAIDDMNIDRSDVSEFAPTVGTWHFYRLRRSGGQLELCVDGQNRGTVLVTGPLDSTVSFRLGRYIGDDVFFDGTIDEVRVLAEALPCSSGAL